MTRLNREEFLGTLESLQPGLTQQEVVEQSSCFILKDGLIMSYNEEIACSHKSPIKLEGAVRALPLIELLRRLVEEEIEVEEGKDELLVIGKRKRAGIKMEAKILLPIEAIEKPEKWHTLPDQFGEAVSIVEGCAGRDAAHIAMTCIHLAPDKLESCDNYQAVRYNLEMNLKEPILVRRDSLRHIAPLGMYKFSLTKAWIHFKNKEGLVFSCRRILEEYPDIDFIFNMSKSQKMVLPKGLGEAANKAQIFSAENPDDKDQQVLVELRAGRLRITGEGASGWFSEVKKLVYEGPALSFLIDPKLLTEITSRHTDCKITPDRLKVDGGKFVYVSCLSNPEENNGEAKQDKSDESDDD